MIPGNTY